MAPRPIWKTIWKAPFSWTSTRTYAERQRNSAEPGRTYTWGFEFSVLGKHGRRMQTEEQGIACGDIQTSGGCRPDNKLLRQWNSRSPEFRGAHGAWHARKALCRQPQRLDLIR